MIIVQEVKAAIKRLTDAGFWIQNIRTHWESLDSLDEDVLFNGATENPKISQHNSDWFSICYENHGSKYLAVISIGQREITIKTSNRLDEVADAIINYFELRNVLPKLPWRSGQVPYLLSWKWHL